MAAQLLPNIKMFGNYGLTKDRYDPSRMQLDFKKRATEGDEFTLQYNFITDTGDEVPGDLYILSPTLSFPYGAGKPKPRPPKPGEQPKPENPNAAYHLVQGFRVVQDGFTPTPHEELDDKGNFVRWVHPPRKYKIQDEPTGNTFRGDDVKPSEAHVKAIIDDYELVDMIQAQAYTLLATHLSKKNKGKSSKLVWTELNDVLRPATTNPYVDHRNTIDQFVDIKGPKDEKGNSRVVYKCLVSEDTKGNKKMSLEDFIPVSAGARAVVRRRINSMYHGDNNNGKMRVSVDRVLLKRRGVPPGSDSGQIELEDGLLVDDEGFATYETNETPDAKRVKTSEEEDESVFA